MKATRAPSWRPRDLTRLLRRPAQYLHHAGLLHVLPDPERLAQPPGAARLEDVGDGVPRGRGHPHDGPAGAEEPSAGERDGRDDERDDERRGRGAAAAARARGRQIPFSGHCASPCRRPKPQAFIIPTWQIEKSKRTGSTGSIARSEAVMSAAMRHPGDVYRVSRRHRPSRITCVSSGTISFARGIDVHAPRSTSSRRTIQRRNRFRRLQPLPPTAAERNSRRPCAPAPAARRRPSGRAPSPAAKSCPAPRRCRSRPARNPPEEPFDRSGPVHHLPQKPEKRDDVDPARPAMDHRAELRVRRLRVEPPHVLRRGRSQHPRERFDGVEHARHAPERERRRAEPDDLLVRAARIPPDDLDRIRRRVLAVVRLVQLLEPRAEILTSPASKSRFPNSQI